MEDLLKILVVDDEPEARELLKYMVQECSGASVVGVAGNVDEAISFVNRERPHLVLLDIQMPEKDGFHFIEMAQRSAHTPGIIFVTAYEHYAIQAIRNSVFDYILKPVHLEELKNAIDRFRARNQTIHKQDIHQLIEALKSQGPDKIKLNTRSGYILIDPTDVVYCKADGNYTHLQLTTGIREITTQNLGSIQEMLEDRTFFRASRSYLLNLKYLTRVDRKSCNCMLEYADETCAIKIPSQKVRLLESVFNR